MGPWRSSRSPNTFPERGNGPGSATPPSGIRSEANGAAWQSFRANRAPVLGSAARGATVPRALEVRNSISQVHALSAIHRAFGDSGFGKLRFGLNASVSANSRFGGSLPARPGGTASRTGIALRNSFRSGFASNRFGFRDFDRFRSLGHFGFRPPFGGFPFRDFDNDFDDFFFFRRPFFGCFGCGFGFFGFNFGFGAPWWWASGWPGYAYGLPYGYSLPYDFGLTYDSSAANGQQSDNSSAFGTFARTPQSAENPSATLLLYLKDGTMHSVRDCWLVDGNLHYTARDGSEGVVELDAIDIQRTVDENAKRGVPFTLKPRPTSSKPPY
jgi:hypothetical protein